VGQHGLPARRRPLVVLSATSSRYTRRIDKLGRLWIPIALVALCVIAALAYAIATMRAAEPVIVAERAVAISRDGREMAVIENFGDREQLVARQKEGEREQLLDSEVPGSIGGVTFAATGERIAFVSPRGGAGRRDIWQVDRRAGTLRRLTARGGATFPRYSPDGTLLIYTSGAGGVYEPRVVHLATGNDVRLGKGIDALAGDVSPDGQSVAVIERACTWGSGGWGLAVVPIRGADVRRIVTPVSPDPSGGIRWSPDGRSLYFISNGGTPNVWLTTIDGRLQHPVTNFHSGTIVTYELAQDGKSIEAIRAR